MFEGVDAAALLNCTSLPNKKSAIDPQSILRKEKAAEKATGDKSVGFLKYLVGFTIRTVRDAAYSQSTLLYRHAMCVMLI